jgi:hypothetical protein
LSVTINNVQIRFSKYQIIFGTKICVKNNSQPLGPIYIKTQA